MWNNFITNYGEEETVYNIFSTYGIFKITPENEITKCPNVQSDIQNEKIAVAVDTNLFLLENERATECDFCSFESKIDSFVISQSGDLIIVLLSDGAIHGVHIKGSPIFHLVINEDDIRTESTFIDVQEYENCFYVICANGAIYKLSNIDEINLNKREETMNREESYSANETIVQNVPVVTKLKYPEIGDIQFGSFILGKDSENFLFMAGKRNSIILTREGEICRIQLPENCGSIKKAINLGNFIIILSDLGWIFEICPFTKILLGCFNKNLNFLVDDLLVMDNNEEAIELLILTKSNDTVAHSRRIVLISFPEFQIKYEIVVPEHSWLVNQSKNSLNLYYLSGSSTRLDGLPEEIEMKFVYETEPTERLKKLIRKNLLKEAEDFAQEFNLSLQPIYEAKVKNLLMEINDFENKPESIETKFSELMSILKQVNNVDFFLKIRFAEIPNRDMMYKFLNELLLHLDEKRFLDDTLEIKEEQLRIETLNLLDPYECDIDWLKFVQNPNILRVCISLFKTDISKACLIWKRHSSSIIPKLDYEDVIKLLDLIPTRTQPFNIIQWLRHFTPTVLQTHPETMSPLIEWCIQKTRSLQFSKQWPEEALEFATNIKMILEDVQFLFSDIRRKFDKNMEKLYSLVFVLQDLSVLKKSYNLIITLDKYSKESMDATAMHLFQRINIDKLTDLIENFLYPIYMEKGLSPVEVIKDYIKFLVTYKNCISYWLERTIILIEFLHNEEEKLKHVLIILRSTPVPWPETAFALLKYGNSNNPIALEIFTEFGLQAIKLLKIKYGWPMNSTDNMLKLIFRIVKCNLPEKLEDIQILLKAIPDVSKSANFYCCYDMVKKGEFETTLLYIRSLEEKQRKECLEMIINTFLNILENSPNKNEEENLIEFLKVITSTVSFADYSDLKSFYNVHSAYVLKRNFNVSVKPQKLECKQYRKNILKEIIPQLVADLKENKSIINSVWDRIKMLSKYLKLEKVYVAIEICEIVNYLPFTCAVSYNVFELEEGNKSNCEDFLYLISLLIAQQIEEVLQDNSASGSELFAYPLAYKLLTKITNCCKLHQREFLEILQWMNISSQIYSFSAIVEYYKTDSSVEKIKQFWNRSEMNISKNKSNRSSISIFENIKDVSSGIDLVHTDPIPIVKSISIPLLIFSMNNPCSEEIALSRIQSFLSKTIEYDSLKARKILLENLDLLLNGKQFNAWYTIIQYVQKYQKNSNLVVIQPNFFASKMRKMFRHMLAQSEPNFTDLFATLLCDENPKEILQNLENEIKSGTQKINYLKLAERYYIFMEDILRASSVRERRLKYYYYNEFCKKDTSMKSNIEIESISIFQFEKELRKNVLDTMILEKLSRDFDCDYQEVLISQIIAILQNEKPIFETKLDAFEKEEFVIKVTEAKIFERCLPYIKEIRNTSLLVTKLRQFLKEINYYFYELYLVIIDILNYVDALPQDMDYYKRILMFLKHKMVHKRRHRPGQTETDWWLKAQSEGGVLPKIAKYRFPFLPLVEERLEKILKEEVYADNCESWFPLIRLHTEMSGEKSEAKILSMQEYFCMVAVNNSVLEYKQQHHDSDVDSWNLNPVNNAFLQSILRLIKHIYDKSKIIVILYFVTNNAPEGADQVEAAHECYKFALENEAELMLNEKAEVIVPKIKRKYPIYKIQHLLHTFGLAEEKLLQLVENPKELINALYHHEAILELDRPDINKIAQEIAKTHNIDLEMLQISLLKKWFCFDSAAETVNLNETLCDEILNDNSTELVKDFKDDEFISRGYYILSSWNSHSAVQFLISHMFAANGYFNTGKQLQMFECCTKLMDEQQSSYKDLITQEQFIEVKCVHYLRRLGYNFTIEKFSEYDKLEILKKVWINHASNPLGLETLTCICLGYDIFIPQIWNSALKQMAKFNMVTHLNSLIDTISCKPQIVHTDGIRMAWECVLRASFKNANRTRSNKQEEILYRNLFRIQSCPVISKLNLKELAEDCIRIDRPHMAAILIAFASNGTKEEIKELIRQSKYDGDLRKEILELQNIGILSSITNFVLKILNL